MLSSLKINAQHNAELRITRLSSGTYVFVIQHAFHQQFGCAFPVTYRFLLPEGCHDLTVKKKYSYESSWSFLPEKQKGDIFNEDEAVRFDYDDHSAYISASLYNSDSLFIQITDRQGLPVNARYERITKFYDDRKSAVTVSADDWYDEYNTQIKSLLDLFRNYGLYVTIGVTTHGVTQTSWTEIQNQLNKGYVEIASHSRSHPFTPYQNANNEIQGSLRDITENLNLPERYAYDGKELVYVWIAPSGDYDSAVDSQLTASDYLVPRLYLNHPASVQRIYTSGDSDFSEWNENQNHFAPHYPGVELGAPEWGGGDTSLTSLNNLFDSIVSKDGIYHPMWHPQVLINDTNKKYLTEHLKYISNRPGIWYVNLGPLYLYHLIEQANVKTPVCILPENIEKITKSLKIDESLNDKNLCCVQFRILKNTFVNITIYNSHSEKVLTQLNRNMDKGIYETIIDAHLLQPGKYTFQFTAGTEVHLKEITRK